MRNREELVKSALRYGHAQAKVKFDRPIETLSTFKPFTVRELDFEVWESQAENQVDNILQQYSQYGMLAPPVQMPQ
jgi:1,4-dihydroxy-2-naphthoyl-CoA synthase